MRAATILSPNPDGIGGVERFCRTIARILEAEGWEPSIVGPRGDLPVWAFRLGGAPLWLSRSVVAQIPADDRLVVSNGFLGGRTPRRHPRIHVVHGTTVGHTLAGGASLPARERVRRVVGGGFAEALGARGATVVSVAESAAREVERYYRAKVDAVIPNGVDLDNFSPGDRDVARRRLGLDLEGRYALYVGRIEGGKGAGMLEPACRAVGWDLIVTGTNPQVGRPLGVLSEELLVEAYRAADCVLFPTLYEGCSFVVLEALACGVPLVTTRVGYMQTILKGIPEYEALVVEPNADAIAGCLAGLGSLDLESLTRSARSWVAENNGIGLFERRWRGLIAEVARATAGSG